MYTRNGDKVMQSKAVRVGTGPARPGDYAIRAAWTFAALAVPAGSSVR